MAIDAVTSQTTYTTPTQTDIDVVGDLPLLDESGKSIPFRSLWSGSDAKERNLLIFIRHFYCGLCEAYVELLSERLPQSKLSQLNPPVRLVIIGCGTLAPVVDYKKRTKCGFPIYCDPDRKIYSGLGMIENLGMGGKKPGYLKSSVWTTTINSAYNALMAGRNSLKAGNYAQNGGELLFESGQLTWCHRMQNTRDHAEVEELEKILKL